MYKNKQLNQKKKWKSWLFQSLNHILRVHVWSLMQSWSLFSTQFTFLFFLLHFEKNLTNIRLFFLLSYEFLSNAFNQIKCISSRKSVFLHIGRSWYLPFFQPFFLYIFFLYYLPNFQSFFPLIEAVARSFLQTLHIRFCSFSAKVSLSLLLKRKKIQHAMGKFILYEFFWDSIVCDSFPSEENVYKP